ncbi:MAG: hypothetical protein WC069_06185 [Candidatus Shapirobacteria bacterium]
MADIAITATSVLKGSSGNLVTGTAGTTITAGQVLYLDSANKLQLADSDGSSPAFTVAGIALNGGAVNQPISYVTSDPALTFGGTVLAGDTIWLSDTPGGMTKTFADLESGDNVIVLGVATATTTINFSPVAGGPI